MFSGLSIFVIVSGAILSPGPANASSFVPSMVPGGVGSGPNVTHDATATPEDMKRWKVAAAHGDAVAEDALARSALRLHDYARGADWARKSASHGYAPGETTFGLCYVFGSGVPRNYFSALKWLRRAASQGYAPAELEIGILYRNGWGVPPDDTQAARWTKIAAGGMDPIAQYDLGYLYRYGIGVQQSYRNAAAWYRKAAVGGNALGESGLGDLFALGQGEPQDYARALFWYRKAAVGSCAPKMTPVVRIDFRYRKDLKSYEEKAIQ